MKTLKFLFVVAILTAMATGCNKKDDPVNPGSKPAIISVSVTNITDNAATFTMVFNDGENTVTSANFELQKTGESKTTLNATINGNKATLTVNNLDVASNYTVWGSATNKLGTNKSNSTNFSTTVGSVLLETTNSTVTINTITVYVRVNDFGGNTIKEWGIVYGNNENPTVNDSKVNAAVSNDSFSATITTSPETQQNLRGFVETTNGELFYTENLTATTLKRAEIILKGCSNQTTNNITANFEILTNVKLTY